MVPCAASAADDAQSDTIVRPVTDSDSAFLRRSPGELGRRAVVACAFVSLAAHVALALAFAGRVLRDSGAIPVPTDAISLELLATDVVDQAARPDATAPAASAAAVAPVEGSLTESAVSRPPTTLQNPRVEDLQAVAPDTPREAVAAPPAQETPAVAAEETLIAAEEKPSLEIEAAQPQPDARERTPAKRFGSLLRPRETERKTASDRKRDKRTEQARQEGGARSRGQAASKSAPGRVSASSGDIRAYAALVRARIAANRPAGRGHRGTAVVSFGIAGSGALTYARIARSSGNSALDQAALSAVRRAAPFPPPPAGRTSGRHRMTMPFYFR